MTNHTVSPFSHVFDHELHGLTMILKGYFQFLSMTKYYIRSIVLLLYIFTTFRSIFF